MQVNDVLLGFSLASVIWSGLMFARDVTDEHAERHRRIAHARRRSQRAARGPACGDTRHAEGAEAPALPDGNHGENLKPALPFAVGVLASWYGLTDDEARQQLMVAP